MEGELLARAGKREDKLGLQRVQLYGITNEDDMENLN